MSKKKYTTEQWFEKFSYNYMEKIKKSAHYFAGNPVWAQDIIQEIYCRSWKYAEKMMELEEEALEAYLKNIIRSTVADYFRDRNSHLILTEDLLKLQAAKCCHAYEEPESHIIYQECLESIRNLRKNDRNILNMRIVQGMSFNEIGKILGINETAARKRYERAKKKALEKAREYFST